MKTSKKIAALLATVATTFAVGCAAPSDVTESVESPDSPDTNVPDVTAPVDSDDVGNEANLDPFSVGAQSFQGKLANLIITKLMNHGTDSLLRRVGIGDMTPDGLDRIEKQIAEIREQLTVTRDGLNRSIALTALTDKIDGTRETRVAIDEAMRRYLKVLEFERAVIQARANGDEVGAQQAIFNQEAAVREFVWMFETDGTMMRALARLEDAIVGGGNNNPNLLDFYRWKLRSSGRLLTNAHTQSLESAYEFFENYQALAVFLRAECHEAAKLGEFGSRKWPTVQGRACEGNDSTSTAMQARLQNAMDAQRSKLPLEIPPGVIIDQVSNFTGESATTLNKPIFMTIDGTYSWRPSDQINTPGSARMRVHDIQFRGGSNLAWRIPSNGELAPIFTGAQGNLRGHLNQIFGTTNKFVGQTFIWTNPQVQSRICYGRTGPYEFFNNHQTHMGYNVTATGVDHRGYPDLLPHGNCDWNDSRRANEVAAQVFADTRGGIIATNTTGMDNYM